MASAKQDLLERIERLTEEEARLLLELISQQTCQQELAVCLTDDSFALPTSQDPFESFEPFEASGMAGSRLLIADRR
jgi:hypothetical protein